MKLSVIATLIVAHRAVAYSSQDRSDDILDRSAPNVFLQQSHNSLESLMSRANDKGHAKVVIKDDDQIQPPERG